MELTAHYLPDDDEETVEQLEEMNNRLKEQMALIMGGGVKKTDTLKEELKNYTQWLSTEVFGAYIVATPKKISEWVEDYLKEKKNGRD